MQMDPIEAAAPMEPPPPPQPKRRRITATATRQPTSILDVPDDLLRLILLRLDSPRWLIRAACACRQFRRAVVSGGRAFLRLAASLHPPAIAGHYHFRGGWFGIAFVPSPPPSPPPPPPIYIGRFSLDFLPRALVTTTNWEVVDCHGGLVLLRSCSFENMADLIVCDPLTRRYQGIHHPPNQPGDRCVGTSLLLDGDDGDISVSNFKVLYQYKVLYQRGVYQRTHTCVFNTAADVGDGWSSLKHPVDEDDYYYMGHVAGRIGGSIYLSLTTGNVKVLDSATLKVSKVDMPICLNTSKIPSGTSRFTVVHGASPDPSSPPSTWIIHVCGEALEFFRLVHGGGDWVLETPSLICLRRRAGCQAARLRSSSS
ncbi:hypothetical protein HU200_061034 [Digitaria exilis]|uniref:F-box domain-containing protein n=1 Tax=Digitaria exilis TaxID=1010633 RepID=A0A835A9B0_9POAL|nr:hypothetical protein HU200_061034 [Digitaria exilis]CAB3462620.1 unnamed protein product [Digitaria exilis]